MPTMTRHRGKRLTSWRRWLVKFNLELTIELKSEPSAPPSAVRNCRWMG
jgi:hypothetical protein